MKAKKKKEKTKQKKREIIYEKNEQCIKKIDT
jgi:hypothetical protein